MRFHDPGGRTFSRTSSDGSSPPNSTASGHLAEPLLVQLLQERGSAIGSPRGPERWMATMLPSFGWDPAASTTASQPHRPLRRPRHRRTAAGPDRISMTITVGYGGLAPERQCKSATTWEPVRFAISVRRRPRTERPSQPYPLRTPVGRQSQSFVRRCHEESTERNTRDGRPD